MIISVILIFVFLLILADLFFLNYLWMNFNNELFNIFNVLLFALFLVFIVLVFIVLAIIKLYKLISEKNIKVFLFGLVIILLIGIGSFLTADTKEQEVVGLTSISAKEKDEKGNYYIVLNNLELKKFVRIKCDKEIFDNIETNRDKLYTITYRFGYFNNDYGNLGNIEEYII